MLCGDATAATISILHVKEDIAVAVDAVGPRRMTLFQLFTCTDRLIPFW